MDIVYVVLGGILQKCHYHEPGAVVEDITRLSIYNTDAACAFHITWRPLHTPWYGLSPSRSYFAEPVHSTVRMHCSPEDPPEGLLLEGCYPNTLHADARHPPEFVPYKAADDRESLVWNIRYYRAAAYIMGSPVFVMVVWNVMTLIRITLQSFSMSWIMETAHPHYHQTEVADGILNAY
jgi:hypothetical protein